MPFSIVVTLGAALLFNLLPALSATRFDVISSLREGGSSDTRRRVRLRSTLVGAQVAVTCALLFATVTFGRALQTMRELRPQWNVDGVLVMSLDLELNGTTPEAGMELQEQLRQRSSRDARRRSRRLGDQAADRRSLHVRSAARGRRRSGAERGSGVRKLQSRVARVLPVDADSAPAWP